MAIQNYHITQRGSRLYYVCRIPSDIQLYFPVRKICRSLKTSNKKDARILAGALEYKTQGLFMALRLKALDEHTKVKMLTEYMQSELVKKEAEIHGKVIGDDISSKQANAVAACLDYVYNLPDADSTPSNICRSIIAEGMLEVAKIGLKNNGNDSSSEAVSQLGKKFKVKLTEADHTYMQKQFLQFDLKLAQAEQDAHFNSDWAKLDQLRGSLDRQFSQIKERYFLKDIATDYLASFDSDPVKKNIRLNSWRAVKRQVKFVVQALGNVEITFFNSKKGKEKLLAALQKKSKSNGEPISAKESSEYMKRLSAIIKFAVEEHDLDVTNKISGTYKSIGAVKSRDTYNSQDMRRLDFALSSKPMVAGRWPKPRNDRFWIILIAVMHGFRQSSIVNLRSRHIVLDNNTRLLCFDLRNDADLLRTKTESMKILCPVHPALESIGFQNWIKSKAFSPDDKLFEDTPESFGAWWNGLTPTSGWNYDHITTDSKKVFHSFRHYFRMQMDELAISDKVINEMMGHARHTAGGTGRKHYAERTMAKRMREIQLQTMDKDRILTNDLNIERLTRRAKDLFSI